MNQFQNQTNINTMHASQIIGQINTLLSQVNAAFNQLNIANNASFIDLDKLIDAKIMVNDLGSKVLDISRNIPRANANPFNQYPGQQYPGQQSPGQPYPMQPAQYPGQQPSGQSYPGQWQMGGTMPAQGIAGQPYPHNSSAHTPKFPTAPSVPDTGVNGSDTSVKETKTMRMCAELHLAKTLGPITKLTDDSVSFGLTTYTREDVGAENWTNFLLNGIERNNTPNKSFIKWFKDGVSMNAWEVTVPSEDGESSITYFILSVAHPRKGTKLCNYRLETGRFNGLNDVLGIKYDTVDLVN